MSAMEDENKELQILLRLKKYEKPPQGFEEYGERFLREFHRRQRWEETRTNGWMDLWSRFSGYLENLTVPRYAYATALAAFGAVALAINGIQPSSSETQMVAAVTAAPVVRSAHSALALNSPLDLSDLEVQSQLNLGSSATNAANRDVQPRYILDTRPASYDAAFSF